MSKRSEKTFHQARYTNGQQAQKVLRSFIMEEIQLNEQEDATSYPQHYYTQDR